MSKGISLFGDGAMKIPQKLMDRFNEVNDRLAGSSEWRRISIRGGRFRKVINGEQHTISKDPTMNIIVVDAAPVSRSYYSSGWDSENPSAPDCWSGDAEVPHPDVEDPLSDRCATCPMNVKGSGTANTRACRFQQRLAVCIEGDMETVYMLQLPAASIFGKPENKKMPMQAFVRVLKEHETPINAIVTQMEFDEESEAPKLFFSPVRPLDEDELTAVVNLMDTDEVKRCLDLTVTQNDTGESVEEADEEEEEEAPPPKKKTTRRTKKEEPEPEPEDNDDDEEEEEPEPPRRRGKKAEPEPEDDDDDDGEEENELAAMLKKWGEDED